MKSKSLVHTGYILVHPDLNLPNPLSIYTTAVTLILIFKISMIESNNFIEPKLQPQVIVPTLKQLKEKRDQRRKENQAALIEANSRSEKCVLFLPEVRKAKTSYCRAWHCIHRRRTGKPNIRSYYRIALRAMSAHSSTEVNRKSLVFPNSGFLLGSIEYYYVTCFERLLPCLPNLVRYGYLKMDDCIAAPPDSHIFTSRSYYCYSFP